MEISGSQERQGGAESGQGSPSSVWGNHCSVIRGVMNESVIVFKNSAEAEKG